MKSKKVPPGLVRNIGFLTAAGIVVANMVGSGIFTTSGLMAAQLPAAGWVMLCWLLGGMIALSGALCYGELATRMPQCGGEYVYLKRLYHPLLGFLTGWLSFFVGFSAPIALSAMGFSEYFLAAVGSQPDNQLLLEKRAMAVTVILFFTVVHYLGTRFGSRVQNFLAASKIMVILGLSSLGVALGGGHWSNLGVKVPGDFSLAAFGTAMIMVMFAYSGWNASAYIAEEVERPKRNLPRSLVGGTLVVVILYLAINIFIFYSAPYTVVKGKVTVVEAASRSAFGPWISDILAATVAVVLLSSLSAFLMIGPRVYFAMARDGLFFSFAGQVNPRYKVPGRSIVIQGIMAGIMVVIGSFEQLLIYVGFALGIFPLLAVFGVFLARRRGIGEQTAVKTWGYPVTPLFFIVTSLSLMVFNFINRPLESSAALVTVLVGIPIYYLWVGLRSK